MTSDTALKELLRMAHENMDSKDAKIAALEKDNKALIAEGDELDKRWISRDKRIAELEKEKAELSADNEAYFKIMMKSHKLAKKHDLDLAQKIHVMIGWSPAELLEKRDLKQEAKGVRDFFTRHPPKISMGKSAIWEVDDVLVDECIERLTNEAKNLKGKNNEIT
jgi:hypothetical protein